MIKLKKWLVQFLVVMMIIPVFSLENTVFAAETSDKLEEDENREILVNNELVEGTEERQEAEGLEQQTSEIPKPLQATEKNAHAAV